MILTYLYDIFDLYTQTSQKYQDWNSINLIKFDMHDASKIYKSAILWIDKLTVLKSHIFVYTIVQIKKTTLCKIWKIDMHRKICR